MQCDSVCWLILSPHPRFEIFFYHHAASRCLLDEVECFWWLFLFPKKTEKLLRFLVLPVHELLVAANLPSLL